MMLLARGCLALTAVESAWTLLGVDNQVARAVAETGMAAPTDVQQLAIPKVIDGLDCIVHAPTGSGKTLAYLVPLLQKVDPSRQSAQAAVIVPSRELGLQVAAVARRLATILARSSDRRVLVMSLLEGSRLRRQRAWAWAEPPQVVVGNARQVLEMRSKGGLRCASLDMVVVDEVDAFFTDDKADDRRALHEILTTAHRQTVFASATIDQPRHFVDKLQQLRWCSAPEYVAFDDVLPATLDHAVVACDEPRKKLAVLRKTLRRMEGDFAVLVFFNEGRPLETIATALRLKDDLRVVVLNPGDNLDARAAALDAFRNGHADVLLATELAARGLDIPRITHVLNFDLPKNAHRYLHRAGRTARLGRHGTAVTLVDDAERFAFDRLANCLQIAPVPPF